MTKKKCPSCGKKIAAKSSYCIYCSARFEETAPEEISVKETSITVPAMEAEAATEDTVVVDAEELSDVDEPESFDDADLPEQTGEQTADFETDFPAEMPKGTKKNKIWLIVSIIGFVVVFVLAVLVVMKLIAGKSKPSVDVPAEIPTQVTVSAERQSWLDSFTGTWVDEQSVGKKDLIAQGGQMLVISDIRNNIVSFDLYSHSGGETHKTAFVAGVNAMLYDDTLHFTFDNDALQHSGEGFLQLHDGGINAEVLIKNIDPEHHTLAMNTVFVRQSLPTSEGIDIRTLHDETALAVFGEQSAEPSINEEKKTTAYTYSCAKAVVNEEKQISSVSVDYRTLDNPSAFCFECFDGTDTYEAVKRYYGEAEQDYEELDTNIFVLHYPLSETSSVTFTFDGTTKQIITVHYKK